MEIVTFHSPSRMVRSAREGFRVDRRRIERLAVVGRWGAGKSTIARRLSEGSPAARAVHLHTDDFYAYVRKGFILPWLPESRDQNVVIMNALAASAAVYAEGGFEVVVDGIVGPWFFDPWLTVARDHSLDMRYVVLLPDEATTVARATSRGKGALTDPGPVRFMWKQFADLGKWAANTIDTTGQSAEDSLEVIRAGLERGDFRLS